MHELAPAKTNLFLEVLGKRSDGFHALDTVFVELALSDRLEFEAASNGQLTLEVLGAPDLAAEEDNLVLRAARLLRDRYGSAGLGATLTLHKRIPIGGGLGGGSSDAAAALRGLTALWRLSVPQGELTRLAGELGSDVAFFVRGGTQRGRGRGEELEPLPPCPALPVVGLVPPFGCPTPGVFRALQGLIPDTPRAPTALIAALPHGPHAVAEHVFNRLEAAALRAFPDLEPPLVALRETPGVLRGWVSGSGSTVLGLCATPEQAESAAQHLRALGHASFHAQVGGP